jgi:hypothetical protein
VKKIVQSIAGEPQREAAPVARVQSYISDLPFSLGQRIKEVVFLRDVPDDTLLYADQVSKGSMTAFDAAMLGGDGPTPARQAGPTDWRHRCAVLIDIYDDGTKNAPEDRCYVDGAFTAEIDEVRALLAAPEALPEAAPVCTCAVRLMPGQIGATHALDGNPFSASQFP